MSRVVLKKGAMIYSCILDIVGYISSTTYKRVKRGVVLLEKCSFGGDPVGSIPMHGAILRRSHKERVECDSTIHEVTEDLAWRVVV